MLTRKKLIEWAGEQVVRDAESLVARGVVMEAEYVPGHLRGVVLWNNRRLNTGLRLLENGHVENQCPCYDNRERGIICAHAIALGVHIVRRNADPSREEKYREEQRHAQRQAAIAEADYIQRASADVPGSINAGIRLTLPNDWRGDWRRGGLVMGCELVCGRGVVPLDQAPVDQPFHFDRWNESLLFVLEDIAGGPAKGRMEIGRADFLNLVRLHAGRELACADGRALAVQEIKVATYLKVDLDEGSSTAQLRLHTELPFEDGRADPTYLVHGRTGWIAGRDHLWPLDVVLPGPYQLVYDGAIKIEAGDLLRFFRQEMPLLARLMRIESNLSLDLFTIEPATPRMRLLIRGSPASLSAELHAGYGDQDVIACKPDVRGDCAQADPQDPLHFLVRNTPAEETALARVSQTGLRGTCGDDLAPIIGRREVLNFLGRELPALRREGWKVELEGRVTGFFDECEFATPIVKVASGENGWFDIGFSFEDGQGAGLTSSEIQLALRKGDAFIERQGRTLLIDAGAVESMLDVFADCASSEGSAPGHFKLPAVYAPFVKTSLQALDGIDVEDTPAWRLQADQVNRMAPLQPVQLGPELEATLRPYQKDGVAWLRFLESNHFCGLLADEMGLGKTLQTLAWIGLPRVAPAARGKPGLIVCPTSLVDNWAAEAARFTPTLKVRTLSGADRHEHWDHLSAFDLVITSYALLRRDLERHAGFDYGFVVLDEAQHIKNRATQNAQAAKRLRAGSRLVLTGTPVENSVADIWSIMDFLMPGYLAAADRFRQTFELPIQRGGPDAQQAQSKLRRKLQPFILRRLKRDVARDLPPKIERIAWCHLTPDQRAVYRELVEQSRRKMKDLVSKRGFNAARFEILAMLMRLRQTCCHLGLLKMPGLKSQQPSGKLELFFELLDEALDGGHRVLVFSQFVEMLTLLRAELAARELRYCYLDGATKERLSVVQQFNTDRGIPVFLISLKAGGTGLNLTGADMVIHFDPWWNPAVEQQATDRAYRIGQKRTVYSVKLLARDTVEEKVLALQARKRAIIDATVEGDAAVMERLTWEDVESLFASASEA